MRNARLIFLLAVLAATVWAAGCSKDDPVTPMEALVDITPAEAENYAGIALEMVNDMATDIPLMAAGDFATAKSLGATGEPEWDPAEQAWILDYADDFSEGDPPVAWGATEIYIWIQFRNAEGPLPTALGATVFEYRATSGMTMHSESEEGVADLAYDLATTMVVTYVTGGYTVVGTGEALVEASFVNDQQSQSLRLPMGWNADLALPLGGCPTGTADVTVGQFRMAAVYDGSDTVAWTLVGPDHNGSGTEHLDCGQPQ